MGQYSSQIASVKHKKLPSMAGEFIFTHFQDYYQSPTICSDTLVILPRSTTKVLGLE